MGVPSDMELTANWQWQESEFRCRINDIQGTAIPDGIRRQIIGTGPNGLDPGSSQWTTGKKIGHILLGKVDLPPPMDFGGPCPIEGL